MFAYIIQGIVYGFAGAMQPGPLQAYLILETLKHGWRRAFPMVFAPAVSDGPVIALVLLVLTQVPVWLIQILKIAGGLFVTYLAVHAWRIWRKHHSIPDARIASNSRRTLAQAALVNVLNPAPYLFWSLVTGPILLTGWREAPSNGISMIIAFYVTMTAGGTAIILLFGIANRLGVRATRFLQLLSTLALAGFGLYNIATGLIAWF